MENYLLQGRSNRGSRKMNVHSGKGVYLFFYGTLRKDSSSPLRKQIETYAVFCGTGSVRGRLYRVHCDYPGLILSPGDERVTGEVWYTEEEDALFSFLDPYEDCIPGEETLSLYIRQPLPVLFQENEIPAWVYIYNRSVEGMPWLESGDFINR